jgi:hypothetical protein
MSHRKKQNFHESRCGKSELRDMPGAARWHNTRVSGKTSDGSDVSQEAFEPVDDVEPSLGPHEVLRLAAHASRGPQTSNFAAEASSCGQIYPKSTFS